MNKFLALSLLLLVLPAVYTKDDQTLGETQILNAEQHGFQAEVNQLMGLIINSLYSQRDIFLRELISNASDALDKIRFLSLTNPAILGEGDQAKLDIRIAVDEKAKTLSITDKGIGMTKKELIDNLGTIAKSGTKAFLEQMSASGDNNLIGQFGVGFYSAFLVGDKIQVTSKSNESDKQYVWISDASGQFTVGEDPAGNTLGRGTEIKIFLKDEALEFMKQETLKKLVIKYSQFINFPIYLRTSHEEERTIEKEETTDETADETADQAEPDVEDAEGEDEDEDDDTEWVTVWDWTLVNDVKPIWTRKSSEVTEEEYVEFYKSFTKESADPFAHAHFSAEGDIEFKALMYIPGKAPSGMFDTNRKQTVGMKLYVRRVFITDDFAEIVPRWLQFVKGVIDSDSLPLNVSREVLQKNQMVSIMNKKVVRKIISMMQELAEEDPEKFDQFWHEYGTHVKLGIIEDPHNRSRLSKLLKFHSSKTGKLTTFEQYVERMRDGQDQIYYVSADNIEEAQKSPLAERLLNRGFEVLYMVDPIDEYTFQTLEKYDNKYKIVNVAKEGLKFQDTTDEQQLKAWETEFQPLTDYMKKKLSDKVEKVIVSNRLTKTPSAIVTTAQGWTAQMEKLVKAQALADKSMANMYKPKKVMELNPVHPIIVELNRLVQENEDDETAPDVVKLLYETASLRSGFTLEEADLFADRIVSIIGQNLKVDTHVTVDEPVKDEPKKAPKEATEEEEKEEL